ncbi:MAG TPA: hypothetical protein VKZ43_05995, partial [Trueperaceae bacterium]|nr:hypothetical protein [Trueperaceae bacterium]
ALAVESLMGMLLSAAVAVCLSLAFTTLSPLLAEAPRVARSRFSVRAAVLLVCLIGVAGAVVLAVRAPTFSALRPQRFSIAHVTEAVQGEEASASWLLDRYPDSRLPEAYLQLGDLRSTTPELLPMGGPFALSAVAPLLGSTPPLLEIVSDAVSGAGGGATRVVRMRLSSAGPFERLVLSVPSSVGVAQLSLPGTAYTMELIPANTPAGGIAPFACYGAACNGLEVDLHLNSPESLDAAFDVAVIAQRSGLPPEGALLTAARPATSVPSQDGDVSVVMNSITVPGSSQ